MNKNYNIKVFDKDGNFLSVVDGSKRISKIRFSEIINGGQRELNIDLKYDFDNHPDYFSPFNFIRVYAVTSNYPKGTLIYSGWISKVIGLKDGIRVTALGLASMLNLSLYKDGSLFDVEKMNEDPATIVNDIISTFQAEYPPTSGYEWIGTDEVTGIRSGGNVDTVGTTVNFTFQKMTWLRAMAKCVELAGGTWFWYVDKGGDVYFREKPSTPTHKFTIDKDIQDFNIPHSIEKIVNDVTVAYDVGIVRSFNSTSVNTYGRREIYIDESSSSDSTSAQQIADQKIAEGKDRKVATTLVINNAYNIETIRAGDTCRVMNYRKDSDILIDNMLIIQADYSEDTIKLRLEEQGLDFGGTLQSFVQKI